jgi:diaminopimelate epimerase
VYLIFSKFRDAGHSCLVVNTVDNGTDDWSRVARRLTSWHTGAGADYIAVVTHVGRFRFGIRCFAPDGSPITPSTNAMRCSAQAIRSRYGYQKIDFLTRGELFQARVHSNFVGLTAVPRISGNGSAVDGARSRDNDIWFYGPIVHVFDGEVH